MNSAVKLFGCIKNYSENDPHPCGMFISNRKKLTNRTKS
jgi:hypothetical protein